MPAPSRRNDVQPEANAARVEVDGLAWAGSYVGQAQDRPRRLGRDPLGEVATEALEPKATGRDRNTSGSGNTDMSCHHRSGDETKQAAWRSAGGRGF